MAVVALLRELGASVKLSTLIEGESLLNDGTTIVLFNLLQPAVAAGRSDFTLFEIIYEFVYVAMGGPLIGFLAGKVRFV